MGAGGLFYFAEKADWANARLPVSKAISRASKFRSCCLGPNGMLLEIDVSVLLAMFGILMAP